MSKLNMIPVSEWAKPRGMSRQLALSYAKKGRIPGARFVNERWLAPDTAEVTHYKPAGRGGGTATRTIALPVKLWDRLTKEAKKSGSPRCLYIEALIVKAMEKP